MRATPRAAPIFLLREWQREELPGVSLAPEDRRLVDELAETGRLEILELRGGLQVRANSWVGAVRLVEAEIRIVPKLAEDRLALVRLLEYAWDLDALWRPRAAASLEFAGTSLLEILAFLFAEACEEVIRRGLFADYEEREEDLGVVRGRILVDQQVLRRFGRLDRIACRFDELEHDVVENQVLLATLQVAGRLVASPSLHRRLSRLRMILEPVSDPMGLDLRHVWGELSYHRLNDHYRRAHELARWLLEGLGVEDLLAPGPERCFAFLLDMNVLFERFVSRLLEGILPAREYRVDCQRAESCVIWDALRQRTYTRVIPDVIVQHRASGRSLAIDAKYKLYDERRIDAGDIYQTFLYAYALGARTGGRLPLSCLFYPASRPEAVRTHLRVRTLEAGEGAEIVAVGVPIPEVLTEIAAGAGPVSSELLGLVVSALAASSQIDIAGRSRGTGEQAESLTIN